MKLALICRPLSFHGGVETATAGGPAVTGARCALEAGGSDRVPLAWGDRREDADGTA